MSFVWNPYALLGAIPAAVSWGMSALVYRAAPAKSANRRLSVALALYGVLFFSESTLARVFDSPEDAYAAIVVGDVAVLSLLPTYLLFLATLDTPLVRPLRTNAGTWALTLLALVLPLAFVLRPTALLDGIVPGQFQPWAATPTPLYSIYRIAQLCVLMFAFFCAFSAYRRAPAGTVAKRRAKVYALAFGTHDALWVVQFVLVVLILPRMALDAAAARAWALEFDWFRAIVPTVFAFVLAYGMLRYQLFDLDLKIKRGISRGTLAGLFLAAFFVVGAIAEQYLQRYGLVAGGVAVGLLVFALRPLERLADRVASAAMPGATGSPEYLVYRKMQVYRATLEGALEDGAITSKERAMLDTLARELGIRAEDARAVEAEVTRA